MSFRAWKNVHLVSYGPALLFGVPGVVMNPLLKDRPVDFFDAKSCSAKAAPCCSQRPRRTGCATSWPTPRPGPKRKKPRSDASPGFLRRLHI